MASVPTRASFLESYPEYNGAPGTLIDAKLAAAARRTNADLFQSTDLAADAVMLRAAVLLLSSPHGHKLRSEKPDQVYAWEFSLRQLQRSATMGIRVF
jgi:hypothetical protein